MRLWKVRTLVDLSIVNKQFRKVKSESCWFSTKTKFIYAETAEDAKKKYANIFFKTFDWDCNALWCFKYAADDMSSNMTFDLRLNQSIEYIKESIEVLDEPVTENINTIKCNSTADDFRDWFMNGSTKTNIDMLFEEYN